ncbi:hypothetical protein AJ79_03175 [Helicocarpus griseus UAMH5409]|uniref:YDG domain-containing protein n=1 Tax=Helicocarpus griseus UAMH5409 TaxID=1447875 RepID=A0A2B7Y007_9EURO|nr:hypothetical protein AJ79_03175 [Helicocarpus griseus UAMH5409]
MLPDAIKSEPSEKEGVSSTVLAFSAKLDAHIQQLKEKQAKPNPAAVKPETETVERVATSPAPPSTTSAPSTASPASPATATASSCCNELLTETVSASAREESDKRVDRPISIKAETPKKPTKAKAVAASEAVEPQAEAGTTGTEHVKAHTPKPQAGSQATKLVDIPIHKRKHPTDGDQAVEPKSADAPTAVARSTEPRTVEPRAATTESLAPSTPKKQKTTVESVSDKKSQLDAQPIESRPAKAQTEPRPTASRSEAPTRPRTTESRTTQSPATPVSKSKKRTVEAGAVKPQAKPQATEPRPAKAQTEPRQAETRSERSPTKPKSTQPNATEPKPTEPKPTEPKPTEPKPTEPKPTGPKTTGPKTAEPKTTGSLAAQTPKRKRSTTEPQATGPQSAKALSEPRLTDSRSESYAHAPAPQTTSTDPLMAPIPKRKKTVDSMPCKCHVGEKCERAARDGVTDCRLGVPLAKRKQKPRIPAADVTTHFISTKEKVKLQRSADEVLQLITSFKRLPTSSQSDRVSIFKSMRGRAHQLQFYEIDKATPSTLQKFLDRDTGLPAIVKNNLVPWDIKLDCEEILSRWEMGDRDTNMYRGIEVLHRQHKNPDGTRGKIVTSRSLRATYQFKKDCLVAGENGLQNGQWFPLQLMAVRDGAHGETEAGICGRFGKGAVSIVLSGKGYADIDQGDTVSYCGTHGKDGDVSHGTKLLIESFEKKTPIRVLRSSKLPKVNAFKPAAGIRYDGLYEIQSMEVLDKETQMYRFKLRRNPGQTPIRYTGDEKRPTEREMEEWKYVQNGLASQKLS